MADDFGFRPSKNYTPAPAAGGLATLEERSRHVDKIAALGSIRVAASLPWIDAARLTRDEAYRRLLALPKTAALDEVAQLLDEAIDGAPAMPATIDMLVCALLEVVPLPRPVRKNEFVNAAKASLDLPAPLLSGLLRAMVRTARAAPPIAEILEAAAIERHRLCRVREEVAAVASRRSEAAVSLDWNDPADLEFLEQVGDRVPDAWRAIHW